MTATGAMKGYPNHFITFTCNPKWPEIERFVQSKGLKADDCPDIIARVFKIKLDRLIEDLRIKKIFGEVNAVVYTIEFQKRGLPHAHILLFLQDKRKDPTGNNIDRIISAEIPDGQADPEYFSAVRDYMIHGPCGDIYKYAPCMSENEVCTKYFPKKYCDSTSIDNDGYPIYMRREDGRTVSKNGVLLDNQYIVQHNRELLLKVGAHINVEWCNQSRSIKYLFKYVNKGLDRISTTFTRSSEGDMVETIDEIDMYYDCRYISPCEAAWKIFGFEIQYRYPLVERLAFHLENEQLVIFNDSETLDSIMTKPSIKESMFLGWFEANKIYPEARELTYAEFPQKFIWKKDLRIWTKRTKGFSVGRICYVPPGVEDSYYLRILLNVVWGATCYSDFLKNEGEDHKTLREACYARGLLEDDK